MLNIDLAKEAGDKKGDEREAFMKQCLSAKKETQQDRMSAAIPRRRVRPATSASSS